MTCELAEALETWMKTDVQPLARKHLGAEVVRIENMSSYSRGSAMLTHLLSPGLPRARARSGPTTAVTRSISPFLMKFDIFFAGRCPDRAYYLAI